MSGFVRKLKDALSPGTIRKVAVGVRRNDLLGLAGQLAYFFLPSFFPFLISLVCLVGLLIGEPEAAVKSLLGALEGILPAGARTLVGNYLDRTLHTASTGVLVLGVGGALWLGQAASLSITKAANLSYRLEEGRPFWRLRGVCLVITLGFTLLVAVLTLAVFNVGSFVPPSAGLPGIDAGLGRLLRWAMVFVVVTLALDLLYYLAPDAKPSLKGVTPGGLIATVLMFASSSAFSYYVANLGSYGRLYGQLGTVVVFMIWLYLTGLMVLLGQEMNAALARAAEEQDGVELVRNGHPTGRRER